MASNAVSGINHRPTEQYPKTPLAALFTSEAFQTYSKTIPEPSSCWLEHHFSTRRYALITSLPGRLATYLVTLLLALTSFVIERIGYKQAASNLLKASFCMARYAESNASLKPLVRTINIPHQSRNNFGTGLSSYNSGICFGGSLYFNHLFHSAYKLDIDCDELAIKIAKIFVLGGPKEATEIHVQHTHLMNSKESFTGPHVLTLVPKNDQSILTKDRVSYENIRAINELPNGPYVLRILLDGNPFSYHCMSLVKVLDELVYLFDPAIGLFKFSGKDTPQQINDHLALAYKKTWKTHIANYTKRLDIENLSPANFPDFHTQVIPCISRASDSDSKKNK